MKGKITVLKGN